MEAVLFLVRCSQVNSTLQIILTNQNARKALLNCVVNTKAQGKKTIQSLFSFSA